MKEQIKSFEDLKCWKALREVRNYTSGIIKKLPYEENKALKDQMRRSSRSITENVAEGYGRFHYGENIQFCRISRGSLYELTDQYITSLDEQFISDKDYKHGRELINKAMGLLNGYINYLQRAKSQSKSSTSNNVNEDVGYYNVKQKI